MAERSGFFDAELINGLYDRVYNAATFASFYSDLFGNGVFSSEAEDGLMVVNYEDERLSVRVSAGKAFINGYWYENTAEKELTIDPSADNLDRIDVILCKLDFEHREAKLEVIKGQNVINPDFPIETKEGFPDYIKDELDNSIVLAEVLVGMGSTGIQESDVFDARPNEELCGFVFSVKNIQKSLGTSYITAVEVTQKINNALSSYWTATQVNNKINNALKSYYTKTETDSQITNSLASYATTSYVNSHDTTTLNSAKSYTDSQVTSHSGLSQTQVQNLINTSLSNYYTKTSVDTQIANFAKKAFPVGKVVMSFSNTNWATQFTSYISGCVWTALPTGRFPVSAGSGYSVNSTGGEATHTLTVSEMPQHNHKYGINPDQAQKTGNIDSACSITNANANLSVTTDTGGGAAHNNLPPYISIYMWKRTS